MHSQKGVPAIKLWRRGCVLSFYSQASFPELNGVQLDFVLRYTESSRIIIFCLIFIILGASTSHETQIQFNLFLKLFRIRNVPDTKYKPHEDISLCWKGNRTFYKTSQKPSLETNFFFYGPGWGPLILRVGLLYPSSWPNSEGRPDT
jgi:hypothetical protein